MEQQQGAGEGIRRVLGHCAGWWPQLCVAHVLLYTVTAIVAMLSEDVQAAWCSNRVQVRRHSLCISVSNATGTAVCCSQAPAQGATRGCAAHVLVGLLIKRVVIKRICSRIRLAGLRRGRAQHLLLGSLSCMQRCKHCLPGVAACCRSLWQPLHLVSGRHATAALPHHCFNNHVVSTPAHTTTWVPQH
jgi:hypothetical protein